MSARSLTCVCHLVLRSHEAISEDIPAARSYSAVLDDQCVDFKLQGCRIGFAVEALTIPIGTEDQLLV